MATPETLRDDNLQTLPQDLTDQEVQTVTFTPESADGAEGYNFPPEKIREMKESEEKNLSALVSFLKHTETINGWEWAENFVDELYADIKNIVLDDKTINLLGVWGDIKTDKSSEDLKVIQEEYKEEIAKETIKLFDKFNNCLIKYINKLKDQLTSGLENNFQDIPEPTRTKYIRDKEKITGLVDELGQCLIGCNSFASLLEGKSKLSETEEDALEEWLDIIDDLLDDMEDILFIEDNEKKLKEECRKLENKISSNNGRLDWGKERGHIEFDDDKKVIRSRGKEVKVDVCGSINLRLEGLDLNLINDEGIWLANFKNRIKYKYGNKKVTVRGKDKPTFYIGPVELINHDALNNYFYAGWYREKEINRVDTPEGGERESNYLETEKDVMEKICEWLNK